jgi:UDP-N-acetylmuramoyl-L-alanyl-D-glutamate--2,6-diaminopimelate ligase
MMHFEASPASARAAASWLAQHCRGTLRTDSRQVQPGDAFIAWPGHAHDGRAFVPAALAAGASACLVEAEGVQDYALDDTRVAVFPSLKVEAGRVADAWYGAPTETLDIVAATGTNGKTSCAWWMAQALSALGRRCGVVGTLGVGEPPDAVEPTGLTTPDPVTLQSAFRRFADDGFAACAIEASSIGVVEHRLAGTRIKVALFTNFTRDHLDFHGSMQAYWDAKRSLFAWPGLQAAVINVDDERGAALARELTTMPAGQGLQVWGVSARQPARLMATNIRYVDGALAFDVSEGSDSQPVRSRLIGDFNVHNLLVVLGGLRALGIRLADAVAVAPQLTPVPGRMQRVPSAAGPEVVVDYAHTPDALEKALISLQPLAAARGGALWCVFGCGGNRDATKRPMMGAIAERLAQRVVITSDNPRNEPPQAIVAQIVAGVACGAGRGGVPVETIVDRRLAIEHALRGAAPEDVVLIAGKGHERTQEIGGAKYPFSDVEEATRALALRGARS